MYLFDHARSQFDLPDASSIYIIKTRDLDNRTFSAAGICMIAAIRISLRVYVNGVTGACIQQLLFLADIDAYLI